jgi:pimeloyl-ACP methyl ester carboxylesterase
LDPLNVPTRKINFLSGFLLWRAGYDVWLSNQRGTLFSEDHTNNSISYLDYWDFGFHEIGVFDIASQIELIKNKTNNSKIIFIGHSMGSNSGLIYAALKNRDAEASVKIFILMALPCYFEHNSNALVQFGRFILFLPFVQVCFYSLVLYLLPNYILESSSQHKVG